MNYAFPQHLAQSQFDNTAVLFRSVKGRGLPAHRRLRVNETIARDLGIAITSGLHGPGDRLADEVSASKHLGVSRSAYREAIATLVDKGLLDTSPKVGTTVNPREKWNLLDPDVLAWIFSNEPDLDLLESLFELRTIVESEAACFAAKRRTKEQLWRMRIVLERLGRLAMGPEGGVRTIREFHTLLLHATANPFLITLASGITAAVDATSRFMQRERRPQRNAVGDYTNVFQAIESMDSACARKEMETLIRRAYLDISNSTR